MMRHKRKLIFESRKDAPNFTMELRQALEPLRGDRRAGELKFRSMGMLFQVWFTPMTEGRAGSRDRWTLTSKTGAAPQPLNLGTIDQLIALLCSDDGMGYTPHG